MRDKFFEYYRPTAEEFGELWSKAVFAFDANVILNFYRYSEATAAELAEIIRKLSGRVWVPHQAASEFHRNRLSVISDQISLYDEASKRLKQFLEGLQGSRSHPFVDAALQAEFSAVAKKMSDALAERKGRQEGLYREDPTLDLVTSLFAGKVGDALTDEALRKVYAEGKERYAAKVPPGFRDKKDTDARTYGDLVLWFQVIEHAKAANKPVILVTDDVKDDWWRTDGHDQKVGPRPELLSEFRSKVKLPFWMYEPGNFIKYAADHLKAHVSPDSVQEVRDISQSRNLDARVEEGVRAAVGADVELLDPASAMEEFRTHPIAAYAKWIEEHERVLADQRRQRIRDIGLELERYRRPFPPDPAVTVPSLRDGAREIYREWLERTAQIRGNPARLAERPPAPPQEPPAVDPSPGTKKKD